MIPCLKGKATLDNLKAINDKIGPQDLARLFPENHEKPLGKIDNDNCTNGGSPRHQEMVSSNVKTKAPVSNTSVLKALEKLAIDLPEILEPERDTISKNYSSKLPMKSAIYTSEEGTTSPREIEQLTNTYLRDSEIEYLRKKISQLVDLKKLSVKGGASQKCKNNLENTQDSELSGEVELGLEKITQDDYNIEELHDDFLYDLGTHHIEVEVKTLSECLTHGTDFCDCPLSGAKRCSDLSETNPENTQHLQHQYSPSCEFTFECNEQGKLVPTYSNVEEKLRLMSLEAKKPLGNLSRTAYPSDPKYGPDFKGPDPISKTEGHLISKKKKKNKKKKKKTTDPVSPSSAHSDCTRDSIMSKKCCLFCEYELTYGRSPRQMLKWFDEKVRLDQERRLHIKHKLEKTKLKASKRQKELREKQAHHNSSSEALSHEPQSTESTEALH